MSEQTNVCEACGKSFDHEPIESPNGEQYCSDGCMGEHWSECAKCGDLTHRDDCEVVEDAVYCCTDCVYDSGYTRCEHCGDWVNENYDDYVYIDCAGTFCDYECASNAGFSQCERCGDWVSSYDIQSVGYDSWCEQCVDNGAWWCDECEEYVPHGRECGCGNNRNSTQTAGELFTCDRVRDYGWKPSPAFVKLDWEKSAKLFTGFELELDWNGGYRELDSDAAHVNEASERLIYCKSDCTCSGFEMVSHPFTYQWWRKNHKNIMELWKHLATEGYRSFHAANAGMHVHMSLEPWKRSQLLKFMEFFYRDENRQFMLGISQRKESRMRQWANLGVHPREYRHEARTKCKRTARSVAVNITRHTAEVRLFRGTLHPVSFQKNLEFVNAMYHFSRETSLRKTHFEDFLNWMERTDGYVNLRKFMDTSPRFRRLAFGSEQLTNDLRAEESAEL
jgi:hypothetical protein